MRRKMTQIAAVLAIVTGAALFVYPMAVKYLTGYTNGQVIEQFQTEVKRQTLQQLPEKQDKNEMDLLYERLLEYNRQLNETGQSGISDTSDYEKVPFDLTAYGFSQNVIGTLWIPRMDLKLPVYLGAGSEMLAKGAGLLGGTSMPVEGESTNVVLAGHRGYRGIPMFRDIQLLQIGDKIQLTTPWENRIYRVSELKIILPDDTDAIRIQPGRQLLTLFTCHPYTKNYQRYMVVAEFETTEQTIDYEADRKEAADTFSAEAKTVMLVENGEETEVLVESKSMVPVFYEGTQEWGAEYSQFRIFLETYGIWILFAAAGMVVLIRFAGQRRKKREDKTK